MDNSKLPLVSVIVPCYNSATFLEETLNSVIAQTYTNWECIVVDNGSTDHSKKIAEEYAEKDSRFKSLSEQKRGVSATRNTGIAASHGKYILPLDGDDKIAPVYMEKAVQILEDNVQVKLVYCEVEFFGEWTGKWDLRPFSIRQLLIENIIFCTSFFRRSDFDQTKGYNESMVVGYEDWDFWLSLLKNDSDVVRIPEVLFFYRIRKSSRNNSLDEEKVRLLRRQIYENHTVLYHSVLDMSELVYYYYLTTNNGLHVINSSDYMLGKKILTLYRKVKRAWMKLIGKSPDDRSDQSLTLNR